MKRHNHQSAPLCLGLLALLLAFVGSCSNKQRADDGKTPFEQSLTAEDTANVEKLVDSFFELLERGDAGQAAAMLYQKPDSDAYGEPQLLDNEKLASVEMMLRSFPIIGHRIDYIKFSQTYANEVKVTAIIAEPSGNMPEVSTVFYFRPIDYLGGWRLCMMDSNTGATPILDNDAKDSVERNFEEESETAQTPQ